MIDSEALSTIAQHDRSIRAWAYLARDAAAQAAPDSHNEPLAGLSFGVKDVMEVRGMPTRHGAALEGVPPARFDAACVAMLRSAGAIPIGKTVTAEFAVTAPGPTRNPWRLEHTPGGSSSGSAAAVAAGMVPFAIGTQTGGSIIRPAAFNGVVGFKPSFGRVPRTGMQVLCDSLDTIGWFTPDVALARRVAAVFMGNLSGTARNIQTVSGLRIAVMPAVEVGELSDDSTALLTLSAKRLTQQGAKVEWPESAGLFRSALAIHAGIMRYELARGLLPVIQAEPAALRPQTLEVVEQGLSVTQEAYAQWQQQRRELQSEWQARFADFDLILTPSAPGTAPQGHSSTGSSIFNRTWSLLGWPSVHLPIGKGVNGLPLGLQCVGKPAQDMSLLALAETLHAVLDTRTCKRPKLATN